MPLREFILSVSQSLRMSGKAVLKKTGRPPSNSNCKAQESYSSDHKIYIKISSLKML